MVSTSKAQQGQILRFPLKYMQHESTPLPAPEEFFEHFWNAIAAANTYRHQ